MTLTHLKKNRFRISHLFILNVPYAKRGFIGDFHPVLYAAARQISSQVLHSTCCLPSTVCHHIVRLGLIPGSGYTFLHLYPSYTMCVHIPPPHWKKSLLTMVVIALSATGYLTILTHNDPLTTFLHRLLTIFQLSLASPTVCYSCCFCSVLNECLSSVIMCFISTIPVSFFCHCCSNPYNLLTFSIYSPIQIPLSTIFRKCSLLPPFEHIQFNATGFHIGYRM